MSLNINESHTQKNLLKKDLKFRNTQNDIKNNWQTTLLWDVYTVVDTNKNKTIDSNEIQAFNQKVQKAFGDDNTLDKVELNTLAKKLGVIPEELKQTITQVNGIALADNLHSTFKPGFFKDVDKDAVKKLLKEINITTVADTWARYKENNTSLFGQSKTLADSIVEEFGKTKESSVLLKNLATTMYQYARKNNIPCKEAINEYNKAVKNSDFNKMLEQINELGARFQYAQRTKNANWIHANITEGVPEGSLQDAKHKDKLKQLEKYAKDAKVEITPDLLGDGIIGNTESKPTSPNNKKAEIILNTLKELLKDKSFKEKLQSCYRKEGNVYAIYFPNNNARFCTTDVELVEYKRQIPEGVIGDGDMSAMVTAIAKTIEISLFKDINNEKDAKEHILKLFN